MPSAPHLQQSWLHIVATPVIAWHKQLRNLGPAAPLPPEIRWHAAGFPLSVVENRNPTAERHCKRRGFDWMEQRQTVVVRLTTSPSSARRQPWRSRIGPRKHPSSRDRKFPTRVSDRRPH